MKSFSRIILLLCIALSAACTDNSFNRLEAIVSGYGSFGEFVLNVDREDMEKAGFTPGDCITATIAGSSFDMPYYTGYFTTTGELLIVDYPNSKNIILTAANIGLTDRFPDMENHTIRFELKEKGRYLEIENTLGMQYSNNRDDFQTDEKFANAREVTTTGMAPGLLFRSASPFDNTNNRAPFVSAFLQTNGVKTALDLTDNDVIISRYNDVPAYSQQIIDAGDVVLCKVDANYRSKLFNETVASGLIELMNHPAPYVVHCTEGKDRTGYICALLEALAGASYDEICDDYLVTYDNYFHITLENDPGACRLLLNLRLDDAMMFFCGIDDAGQLHSIDLSQAMERHLKRYGMSAAQVQDLKNLLTGAASR